MCQCTYFFLRSDSEPSSGSGRLALQDVGPERILGSRLRDHLMCWEYVGHRIPATSSVEWCKALWKGAQDPQGEESSEM